MFGKRLNGNIANFEAHINRIDVPRVGNKTVESESLPALIAKGVARLCLQFNLQTSKNDSHYGVHEPLAAKLLSVDSISNHRLLDADSMFCTCALQLCGGGGIDQFLFICRQQFGQIEYLQIKQPTHNLYCKSIKQNLVLDNQEFMKYNVHM
jgi:hypothetical protein